MSALTTASRTRQKVLGYPVDLVDEQLALQIIDESWRLSKGLHVATVNAEMIIAAQQDQLLDRIVRHAHLIIPDGSGVVWALRLAGHKVDRLPGIELAGATLKRAAAAGRTVALLGGKPEVLDKLIVSLPESYPGLKIVASHHGYFTGSEEEEIVDKLAQAAPELILVALGVPKQEYFIDKWQDHFSKSVLIGVGGSFDVWVGNVKRAPAGFRKMHLEWLYRLMAEPWRYKRMGAALPQFALQVLNDLAQKKLTTKAQHGEKRAQTRSNKKHDKKKIERSKDK
jgi:N-acetylglucosaminyldiphosphoundecaprenol N-acetyl-beta-D-mannosaminyltransferase